MNIKNKEDYANLVKEKAPKSPLLKDCIISFIVGGIICSIGQFIMNILANYGCSTDDTGIYTSSVLIVLSSILTGLGLYSKFGKFSGAGTIIPITGFSNSITSPAIEFKKEGYILGLGAKIFIIAGPVILYGLLTSVFVGVIYYILT
ncbi:MAG: stage V sporulation protein AC [Lachnospirales bacterium]